MADETLEQMKADFVADSSETLDRLAQRLSELDRRGPFPRDLVDELLRKIHSLRGTAGMFGLDEASAVAKSFESLLEAVRSGKAGVTADLLDLSVEVLDALGLLLGERAGDRPCADAAVRRIELWLGAAGSQAGQGRQEAAAAGAVGAAGVAGAGSAACGPVPEAGPVALSVKVDIALLDSIINTVSELFSAKLALAAIAKRLPRQSATRKIADDLLKASLQLDKRLQELQSSVIDARLVPVSILFYRFRAEVRRLARLAGKDVELVCEGESTRIDRAVLDRLHDPLLHIIRNAVGHGIEDPGERSASGKAARARIVLAAGQEASHVRIDVEDDGRGIDLEAIRAVANAKGFSTADADSALDLLFRPGFTTKTKQDDISGRGVGLDAVRTHIEALGGMVTVSTQRGKGTRFSLWVPLTLAMSRGMLIGGVSPFFSWCEERCLEVSVSGAVSGSEGPSYDL
jgi:two-component system chemotaxis sensor kinase CheA